MEINKLQGIVSTYRSHLSKRTAKTNSEKITPKNIENTDRIEFDFNRSLEAAKTNIAKSLSTSLDNSQVESLSDQLQSGDFVDSHDLAGYILGF